MIGGIRVCGVPGGQPRRVDPQRVCGGGPEPLRYTGTQTARGPHWHTYTKTYIYTHLCIPLVLRALTCACARAGARMVNPWNTEDVAHAIYEALTLPASTRAAHHARLMRYVRRHTAAYWGASFMSALEVRPPSSFNLHRHMGLTVRMHLCVLGGGDGGPACKQP